MMTGSIISHEETGAHGILSEVPISTAQTSASTPKQTMSVAGRDQLSDVSNTFESQKKDLESIRVGTKHLNSITIKSQKRDHWSYKEDLENPRVKPVTINLETPRKRVKLTDESLFVKFRGVIQIKSISTAHLQH